jgi:hypothetical protein
MEVLEWLGRAVLLVAVLAGFYYLSRFVRGTGLNDFHRR